MTMDEIKCPVCRGEPRNAFVFDLCETHNVCVECGISHAEAVAMGTPWAHIQGWICVACNTRAERAELVEGLKKVRECEVDGDYLDAPTCPHCGLEDDTSGESPSVFEGERECERCGGKYEIEAEYSVTYCSTIVGERVTLESLGLEEAKT
jgi:hypothetical protein